MTRIDFYVLSEGSSADLDKLACILTQKALARGSKVHIAAAGESQARQLDEYLWSFQPASFVPHALADKADQRTPVTIGTGEPPEHCEEILINLTGKIPAGYQRFERVLELVPAEQEARQASRDNYQHYRERGYPLEKHEIQL